MKFQRYFVHGLSVIAYLLIFSSGPASSDNSKGSGNKPVMTLSFAGIDYLHRWSKDGQNEFTPQSDKDLATWREMVTINVHQKVNDEDQLAELANRVLSNYQNYGKVLRTDSKPRTGQRPAEHLMVAVLSERTLLEVAFARVILTDRVGIVAVYSHRVYGSQAGPMMSNWLKMNGTRVEKALMAWDKVPTAAALQKLPQSR